jgi:pSer/pThr/pTyr-binding forkhead associated (FHA) protein
MIDVPKSLNDDFLLLESTNQEKGSARAIHLLIPEKKGAEYILGRGHEADIKIADISVSRFHATIKYSKQGFLLTDNNSKFGTLLLQPIKATFKRDQKPLLQMGRTKFVASVRDATTITYVECNIIEGVVFQGRV